MSSTGKFQEKASLPKRDDRGFQTMHYPNTLILPESYRLLRFYYIIVFIYCCVVAEYHSAFCNDTCDPAALFKSCIPSS